MEFIRQYVSEMQEILEQLDLSAIERMADQLVQVRERGGRAFFLGVGGGAGHASHAVCDFRKLAGIESYAVTDNVSELTAQTNDNGWEYAFVNWLQESRLNEKDLLFVFSVGGGNLEYNISANISRAVQYGRELGCSIVGVVGRDGGDTARASDACVIVPVVNDSTITPHTESFQAVVWHLLVAHPRIRQSAMKWEGVLTGR